MTFSEILPYVSGPVVGAVIGYFTNYIAVKMLFRPYTEKHIGSLHIPFTPGIMPKRRGDLAKAVGEAISSSLFTAQDISDMLLSSSLGDQLVDAAFKGLGIGQEDAPTVRELLLHVANEEGLSSAMDKVAAFLTDKLITAVKDMHIGDLIRDRGAQVFAAKKASLGMLAFVIPDTMIESLAAELGAKLEDYISENGFDTALPVVRKQMDRIIDNTADELLEDIDREKMRELVRSVYGRAAQAFAEKALASFDIAGIVEEKINAMDIRELEELCLSVMKKELNAIVDLGALIGFVLGVINIFI